MNSKISNYNLSASSPSKKPGFVFFQSTENKKYYFHFNDENGEPILFSDGYAIESRRDKKAEGVQKNAAILKLYKVEKEGKQYYFILRAGNYLEIGRSKYFSSQKEMKKTMRYLSVNAPVTQSISATKVNLEKNENSKKVKKTDEQFALKYSYQVHLYPSSDDKQLNGRIINTRTERKGTFTGLDGQSIVDFMKEDLAAKYPALSFKKESESAGKDMTNTKSTNQPKGVLVDPNENLQLKILNKKSGKQSNNLSSGMYYDIQLSPKENANIKLPKTGEKIPLEISIKAINGSNFKNTWTEYVELSSEGIMRIASLPAFPYAGIYRMEAKSKDSRNEKNMLRGIWVVNVL